MTYGEVPVGGRAPGAGRTRNHQIRSLLLCPLSYGGGRARQVVVQGQIVSGWPICSVVAFYRVLWLQALEFCRGSLGLSIAAVG